MFRDKSMHESIELRERRLNQRGNDGDSEYPLIGELLADAEQARILVFRCARTLQGIAHLERGPGSDRQEAARRVRRAYEAALAVWRDLKSAPAGGAWSQDTN